MVCFGRLSIAVATLLAMILLAGCQDSEADARDDIDRAVETRVSKAVAATQEARASTPAPTPE
jgi:hypothetical protein